MPTKQIQQYNQKVNPNILQEYISQFGGVTEKTSLNDMQRIAVKTITFADSPYTVLVTDSFILVDCTNGIVTVQLPVLSSLFTGKRYYIKKIDNTIARVIIDADVVGSSTLDSETTQDILNQNDVISFSTDGNAWYAF